MYACLLLLTLAVALTIARPGTGLARGIDDDIDIFETGDLTSWGYSPSALSVPAGTTVTWHNTGGQAHSITSQDQLFDSRLLDAGRSWSTTFDTPGTYRYFCVPNPWMKGTIVVTAVEESTPRPTRESAPTATPQPAPTDEPTPRPTATTAPTPTDEPTQRPTSTPVPPTPTTAPTDEPTPRPTRESAPTATPTPPPASTPGTR